MLLKIYKSPVRIDKIQNDKLCGVCKKAYEFIDHVVKTCSKVAQRQYKKRHKNLDKIVYQELARKCNFQAGDQR